ncbi:MAG: cupin domain-containing protein [Actinomycetota bacterium]
MEVEPGVFVSTVDTEEWEFDPEVNGEIHVLCSGVGVTAGMSRFLEVAGPVSYTPPTRETLVVLEGSATVRIADGRVLEIAVGDLVSLPAGVETVWNVTPPFKEFWVLA